MDTHQRTTDKNCPESPTNRSITVAVNGGASGWPALDCAAAEASAHHSDLRIMHAISWPQWGLDALGELALDWCNTNSPERGTRILEEAAKRARVTAPTTRITTHLETGETAATILKAGSNDSLIVVGSRQARRRDRRSVASTVARLAKGSVAIVRTPTTTKSKADSR